MYPPSIPHPLYASLPSAPMEWNAQDCSPRMALSGTNMIAFSNGDRPEAACIRTTTPIDPSCSIFYWEMTISTSSSSASPIAVGLSVRDAPLNRFPGWEPGSFGYHGDDGHIFGAAGPGTLYGPTFGSSGDTVGTLVVFSSPAKDAYPSACVRFTKNGQLFSVAFNIDWESPYYPTVGLRIPGDSILTNFGATKPFIFDIDEFIQHQSRKLVLYRHIRLLPLGKFCTSIPEFLAEYLIYADGSSSLASFAESFKEKDLASFSAPLKKQVHQRQLLTSLIKTGNVSQALCMLNEIPGFLASCPQLLLALKCQQLIEAIRPFFSTSSCHEHKNAQNATASMQELLTLAQSIADLCIQHKLAIPKKQPIFSLFLYMEHRPLPALISSLFQEEKKTRLADDLLHSLVVFFGDSPYSKIEIILRHTAVLLREMHSRSDLFPSSLLVKLNEFH